MLLSGRANADPIAASIAAKLKLWWTFDDTGTDSKSGVIVGAAGPYSAAKKANGMAATSAKWSGATGFTGYEAAGMSMFGWVYPTSTASRVLCGLGNNVASGEVVAVDYVSGAMGMNYRNSAGYASLPRLTAAINTWHFFVVSWKPGGGTTGNVEISLNAGTPQIGSKSKGSEVSHSYAEFGSRYSNTAPAAIFDEVGFTLGALTAAEIAYLYNAGAGRAYADLTSPP